VILFGIFKLFNPHPHDRPWQLSVDPPPPKAQQATEMFLDAITS